MNNLEGCLNLMCRQVEHYQIQQEKPAKVQSTIRPVNKKQQLGIISRMNSIDYC